jgi:tRNA A37 methylthiotransferase MiaB
MNRQYSIKEFKNLVNSFRKIFPRIGISTDIICGFPGETVQEFQDSIELVKWLKPDVLNISRFWPRKGTKAAKLPKSHHGRITKERSRILTHLWKDISVEVGEKWIGWEGEILLDEKGWGNTLVGRNYAYKAVGVESSSELGDLIRVRVTGAGTGYLKSIII